MDTTEQNFRLRTNKIGDFKAVLNVFKEMHDEVNILINNDGLKLIQMCKANVSLATYELKSDESLDFEVKQPELYFSVNIKDILDILKTTTKNDLLEISGCNYNEIRISVIGAIKRDYTLKIKDATGDSVPKIPPLNEFKVVFTAKTKTILEILKQLDVIDISMSITAKNQKIVFGCENDIKGIKVDIPCDAINFASYSEGEGGKYSVGYLTILKPLKVFENIKISYAKDYPILIESGDFKFFLAPRVEDC